MHVSDIKKFSRCPKLYELSKSEEQGYFSFYNINTDYTTSVANKLKIDKYVSGQPNQTNEDTFRLINESNWVFKARLTYRDLRVKFPLIHVDGKKVDVYHISLNRDSRIDEVTLAAYNKALKANGFKLNEIYCLYLNADYVRGETLDDDSLWKITNVFPRYRYEGITIGQLAKKSEYPLDEYITLISTDLVEEYEKSGNCSGRKRCQFFEKCYPEYSEPEDNSILTLVGSRYKKDMYNDGIRYLKDCDMSRIEGNKIQYSQIKADENGGLYVNKPVVKNWMKDNVSLPISFIDFEWDLFPIPPYRGMKPLDELVFQYSLHVYDGKELKDYQFIGTEDSRKELVESMIENIPATGTVAAYNATGAEKIRINEFITLFPEYKDKLQSINNRMVDMAIPFVEGYIYDVRMRGTFTLKVIEGMIDADHSYKELDVGNGIEAVDIYRKLSLETDQEVRKKYLEELYQYCGLDTYSLYKVYEWINELLTD